MEDAKFEDFKNLQKKPEPNPVRDLIYLAVSISNLVYICRIFIDTKKNPFNLEVGDDKYSYFKTEETFGANIRQLLSSSIKQCKCGKETIN